MGGKSNRALRGRVSWRGGERRRGKLTRFCLRSVGCIVGLCHIPYDLSAPGIAESVGSSIAHLVCYSFSWADTRACARHRKKAAAQNDQRREPKYAGRGGGGRRGEARKGRAERKEGSLSLGALTERPLGPLPGLRGRGGGRRGGG
eukprot:1293941-Rhodomonas_salina.1